jgi:hypothetical protein
MKMFKRNSSSLTLRYKLRIWFYLQRQKWPLVYKKSMNMAIANRQAVIDQTKQRELDELLAEFSRIVPKLARVSIHKDIDRSFGQCRLVLEISDIMVEEVFMHGNDKRMLQYVGEHVGHMVARELNSINFSRVQDNRSQNQNEPDCSHLS